MHGLDEYDSEARWYYPAIMRTTTIDPLAEKYYSISPYVWCGNNPIVLIDPDGSSPRLAKMAIKTVVKSVAKGKLDLGDVYDLVDAGKTLLDPNSSILDKGLAVFDILSPVSSKEIKAGAKMPGVVDGANDAKKVATKLDKSPIGPETVPKPERDPKRIPTTKEKKQQLNSQDGKCLNCDREISEKESRSHHYPKRHADGGNQTVQVCETCYKDLHKKDK